MPASNLLLLFRGSAAIPPTALRVSQMLTRLQTRRISSGTTRLPRSFQTTHRFPGRTFPLASAQKTIQARGVTTIPVQQGSSKVQHVKLLAPRNRVFTTKFVQRVFIAFIFLEAMGWVLAGRKPKDIADVTDATKINSLPVQTNKAGAGGEPVLQDENEDVTITIDEENAFFLPMTWPRRKPPVPYKATDEEWLEFCSFAKDGEKQRAVQGQAVEYTLFVASHHPQLKRVLGKISPQSRYWLDIDYPLKYDEGYEMTGIVVTDDFIAVASRDYDESTVEHFQRVISTVPIVSALWKITKAMFTEQGQFGIGEINNKYKSWPISLPGAPVLDFVPEFQKTLRSSIQQLRARPPALKSVPRGCVRVSGRVDVHGSKAWVEFSIMGYYNPKENAWTELPAVGLGPIRPVSIRPAG